MKWTYEKVKEYVESRGYELLSRSYKSKKKISLKCPQGHIWEVDFHSFKKGVNCPCCSEKGIRLTYDYVKKYIEERNFILISKEYKNARDKIEVECCKCGYKFSPTFDNFKNKNVGCPNCQKVRKYTHLDIKTYMDKFGYELLNDEYNNCREKMDIKCPKGHVFKMNFDSFKNKECRCPICNMPKGERRISEYLDKENISYETQKTFPNLLGLGNGFLSYDFYLPQYNLLIEYQGGFHDGTVTGSYQELYDLDKQQEHDRIKNAYAEKHNIKLLEIWYWDFDKIEEILNEVIK